MKGESLQFSELGLDPRVVKTIQHQGFAQATEIQATAIPVVLAGKDLLASSKTGSGKTLAFLLPALQQVMRNKSLGKSSPRVVILTPTRELAKQVFDTLRGLLAGTSYKAALIVGGENFNDQAKAFRKLPTFIVATAGRLADHLAHHHLSLQHLEMLICDEADRMLDLGFAPQLQAIHQAANHRRRQTLMFSATLDHQQVNLVAKDLLNDPKRVAVEHIHAEHQDIEQKFYLCDHLDHKQALLERILQQEDYQQLIIFTATRADTERLANLLNQQGLKAIALSGEMTQSARNRIMNEFERGLHKILISTDLASRGLDISNVSHVINFDMPKISEEYIHRIGRTGRAGNQGFAFSLIGPKDWQNFKKIEPFFSQKIQFSKLDGLVGKFKGLKDKPQPTESKKTVPAATVRRSASRKKLAPKTRNKSFYDNLAVGEQVFMVKKKRRENPDLTQDQESVDE